MPFVNIRLVATTAVKISAFVLKAASLFLAADDLTGNKISSKFNSEDEQPAKPKGEPYKPRRAKSQYRRNYSDETLDGFRQPSRGRRDKQ